MTTIVIADDHAVVRTGLQLILENETGFDLTDECRNGDELIELLEQKRFDLLLLDVHMPGMDTMNIIEHVKRNYPSMLIVIFTMNDDKFHMVKMLQAGVNAFISKQSSPAEIVNILRQVVSKDRYVTTDQASELAELLIDSTSDKRDPSVLTPREFQVFKLLATGQSNKEIALKLNLSKNTLSNHRNHILKKLQLNNNSDITRFAIKNGLL